MTVVSNLDRGGLRKLAVWWAGACKHAGRQEGERKFNKVDSKIKEMVSFALSMVLH